MQPLVAGDLASAACAALGWLTTRCNVLLVKGSMAATQQPFYNQLWWHNTARSCSCHWPAQQLARCPLVAPPRTLCVLLPASRLAYIWNQWLKMSSDIRLMNTRCSAGYVQHSSASRPVVATLHGGSAAAT
jgi:hypothetical protein